MFYEHVLCPEIHSLRDTGPDSQILFSAFGNRNGEWGKRITPNIDGLVLSSEEAFKIQPNSGPKIEGDSQVSSVRNARTFLSVSKI